jgi:hypothetical protein
MAETVYGSQIQDGVPAGTPVAHMVGFNASTGHFHDVGVVYAPTGPYTLCVLSRGSTREEADLVISDLSRLVYAAAQP